MAVSPLDALGLGLPVNACFVVAVSLFGWRILHLKSRPPTLNGRTVLITGAGSGIGLEAARQAVRAGAVVVCWDVNGAAVQATKQLIAQEFVGGADRCIVQTVDVSDDASVASAALALSDLLASLQRQQQAQGAPDGPRNGTATAASAAGSNSATEASALPLLPHFPNTIVSCAGIVSGADAHTLTAGQVDRTLRVNVGAHFNLLRAFLPSMRASKRGTVVFISSVMGFLPAAQLSDYCASKWATLGLAESLRLELQRDGLSRPWHASGPASSTLEGHNSRAGPQADGTTGPVGDGISVVALCPYGVSTGMFRGIFGENRGHVSTGMFAGIFGEGPPSARAVSAGFRGIFGENKGHGQAAAGQAHVAGVHERQADGHGAGAAVGPAQPNTYAGHPSEPWLVRGLLRPLLFPMLTPSEVASAIVQAVERNVDGTIALPWYAWWAGQVPRLMFPFLGALATACLVPLGLAVTVAMDHPLQFAFAYTVLVAGVCAVWSLLGFAGSLEAVLAGLLPHACPQAMPAVEAQGHGVAAVDLAASATAIANCTHWRVQTFQALDVLLSIVDDWVVPAVVLFILACPVIHWGRRQLPVPGIIRVSRAAVAHPWATASYLSSRLWGCYVGVMGGWYGMASFTGRPAHASPGTTSNGQGDMASSTGPPAQASAMGPSQAVRAGDGDGAGTADSGVLPARRRRGSVARR